jgi:HAD superfamily hydrolase (TIGR01509 family)
MKFKGGKVMAAIKAILFDHDGTLVDSEFIHYQMWVAILKPYGVTLTEEEYIKEYAGIPSPANAKTMVEKYCLTYTPEALNRAKALATDNYLSNQAFPLVDAAKEVITSLAQEEVKLAIVTGAGGDAPRKTLKQNNLETYFETIVSGDDVEQSKPAPDCYLLAAKRLGLEPHECVAIEDTANGVSAAAAANVPCVAIATKMSQHQDLSKAIKIVASLKDAKNWIKNQYFSF